MTFCDFIPSETNNNLFLHWNLSTIHDTRKLSNDSSVLSNEWLQIYAKIESYEMLQSKRSDKKIQQIFILLKIFYVTFVK